jgi:hypothetical protein
MRALTEAGVPAALVLTDEISGTPDGQPGAGHAHGRGPGGRHPCAVLLGPAGSVLVARLTAHRRRFPGGGGLVLPPPPGSSWTGVSPVPCRGSCW